MKAVVLYSGGLDSTVLLWDAKQKFEEVKALGICYGQRHKKELNTAQRIAETIAKVPYDWVDISYLKKFIAGSSQTSDSVEVPVDKHFEDPAQKLTVVPNRNMIMLSIAIGHAISLGYDTVAYAAHQGDCACYPDCRPVFVDAMKVAAKLCDFKPVHIFTPYLDTNKAGIVTIGHQLGAPIDETYSCYQGREKHCGKCGACVERKAAFAEAGILDKMEYEA